MSTSKSNVWLEEAGLQKFLLHPDAAPGKTASPPEGATATPSSTIEGEVVVVVDFVRIDIGVGAVGTT